MKGSGDSADWGERTAADLASLLVELSRVSKAAAYYGAEARTTVSLAERASRAWRADLARAGPLELEVVSDGFAAEGLPGSFGAEHLAEVARLLDSVGVERIRFTEVLSADSLSAFAEALGRLATGERPVSQLGIEVDGEICFDLDRDDPRTAHPEIQLSADSLGGSLLSGPRAAPPASPATRREREDPSGEEAPKPDPDDPHPRGLAEASGAAGLADLLRELDRCDEDEGYIALTRRVAAATREAGVRGLDEDVRHAMLALSDHALGEGGRSGVQARVARATLVELATGEALTALIDRACSRDTTVKVRAAQVLLVLGANVVPPLLERLEGEADADRAGQLTGLLIALGDATVPTLSAAIAGGEGRRARLAIQLAGDLQCPGLVQPLRDLLCAKDGHLHREAARALVEMGNSAALRVLLEALESRHNRTAEIAAFSLGTLAAPRSLSALVRRLERASEERRWTLVREILLAMAQFHEADRATARALCAWIQRGGTPWRRPDLSLKLEAVTTLGQLGGDHTTTALREIAGLKLAPRLCERARRILDRRGDGRLTPR